MKALIQGIPKGFWSADWRHNFINALPMGVLAIANHCNQHGHEVRVANAAIFGERTEALRVMLQRIHEWRTEVVGIPLHWHLTGHDALQTAAFLKGVFPRIRIVVGGLTASVYPVEILEQSPAVDVVVVGDGEIPFCSLLDVLQTSPGDPDFSTVPNLVWRDGNMIRHNGIRYVACAEELSKLDFSPQRSLCSLPEYANGLQLQDAVNGIPRDLRSQGLDRRFFFMNIGRGCSYNCIYCGGCKAAHEHFTGRDGVTVRAPASVLADFRRCCDAGFRRFHVCFDADFPDKDQYFEQLFGSVRGHCGTDLHLLFEVYGLPSRGFLESAARTFSWVGILISPCFFDEQTRRKCKGYSFSDIEMEEKIREIASIPHCESFVYYAVTAMEDWSPANVERRLEDIRRLRARTGVEVSVLPIFAEPGSPWVNFPDLFDEHKFPFAFEHFLAEWKKPLDSWNDLLVGVHDTGQVMARLAETTGAGGSDET